MLPAKRRRRFASNKAAGRRERISWTLSALEPRLMLAADAGVATEAVANFVEIGPAATSTTNTHAETQATDSAAGILFLDSEIEDSDLLNEFAENAEVILLAANRDAITQISETLAKRQDVASIHIVSHGDAGRLRLSGETIDSTVIRDRGAEIAKWSFALAPNADILLYGCSVGAGSSGDALLSAVAELTGADVAASIDTTGSRSQGGNWELEKAIGRIESGLAFQATVMARYQHTLPITGTESNFSFNSFASTDPFDLNGDASISGDKLQLTSEETYQTGSAFFTDPIAVDSNSSFQSSFSFEMAGGWGAGGADGLVFVLQNSPSGSGAIGSGGFDIGYGGIGNSVAIEFDTWFNSTDKYKDEVGVVINGVPQNHLVQAYSPFDLNDGGTYHAWVDYNGESDQLTVYLSNSSNKPAQAILSTTLQLDQIVGNQMYAGFTAADFDRPNAHRILSWSMDTADPGNSGPATINLDASQVTVSETGGEAVVKLVRTGNASETASVEYETSNQSARAGDDYSSRSGVANFAAGQRTAEVRIPILDDTVEEGPETFQLTIRNAVNADLGSQQTTTITILDDEQSLPSFVSFSDTPLIDLNGGASITGGKLQLTSEATYQTGSAFFMDPIEVTSNSSFQSSFSFEMAGGWGAGGADGLVFVLQNSPSGSGAIGSGGFDIGYGGIGNSVAIEFDTWFNSTDKYKDEVGVVINGVPQNHLVQAYSPFDLNDGGTYHAWVDYNGESDQLTVYLSNSSNKPAQAILSTTLQLDQIVGNQMYAGFTAADFDRPNAHRVLSWSMDTADPNNAGPATFKLDTVQVTVSETVGEAVLRIMRTGDASEIGSINYQTYDQSAVSGDDYSSRSGVAYFAEGQRVAEVRIPILDDDLEEGVETFSITIDNPVNAELGAPRTTTITVLDDEQNLPSFTNFNNGAMIDVNGGATVTGGKLQLTSEATYQTGSAFFTEPIDVTSDSSFQTSFSFEMTGGWGAGGADGLVFVLQNSPSGSGAIGGGGFDIGYGGIGNSVAIEFDTWLNETDKFKDEIAVVVNGVPQNHLVQSRSPFDLNDGGVYHAWVDYNGVSDSLAVYLSDSAEKPTLAAMKTTVSLDQIVGTQMYAGFTAADFDRPNAHRILSWWMDTEAPALDPPVLPSGEIQTEIVQGGFNQPTAIAWSADGRNMYVSEKGGLVKVMRDGVLVSTPVIDISAIVNNFSDRGLLDVAVHPDLENQPYMYVLYTYDPPEVWNYVGNQFAGPDATGNRAGRLVRYTLDASTNYTSVIAGSEFVMMGTASTWNNFNAFTNSVTDMAEPPAGQYPDGSYLRDFINSDSTTHSIASLEFAPDGALMVSIGDGGSYNQMDPRVVRVQDIDSLSGKILRIDPVTGQGLSDNPFYNGDGDANRSKVYQLGLRNPFRFAIDDVTGRLFIGDVGWTRWEEINTADPGANFGWPYFEGGQGVNIVTPGGYINLPAGQQFVANGAQAEPAIIALSHTADGIDAVVMGDVIRGGDLGLLFEGDILFNSLGQGVVRRASVNAEGQVTDVSVFTTGAQYVVDMRQGPDGEMYFVDLLDGQIGRWTVV
ncbi:DUF4347 domain-containing protein [Novipirellula artificiosorum]|uniref:Soluble aldose sugar dehydrogenase YliI n=1 Tax=Novipirellula artificiosorum TaxID=2528016 RepID=A0A5C6D842_9BACT|nr:DUF4347 domain-containing protein [Novipirellula artificiosorum]TWU33353.1 Soluble aldose sugar dehydrogenase YliI precursor [Novipirellula artificiosorum]